ncbi:MAG: ABC transporter permease subunit [Halobacteriovoraceae bacterium]|nr:ABC transporter permease subunit [Halobacteriovoraceae bacterium]
MNKIFDIGVVTFRSLFREKVFIYIIVSVALLIPVSIVAFQFSYGDPAKITLDIALGLASLSSCFAAIFLGAYAINGEKGSKSIYVVLSKDISRGQYIIGKWLGVMLLNGLNVLCLCVINFLIFLIFEQSFILDYFYAFMFTLCESAILLSVCILASVLSNIYISFFVGLSVFLFGNSIEYLSNERLLLTLGPLKYLLKGIKLFTPNLSNLNIKINIIYGQGIDFSYFTKGIVYTMLYLIVSLVLSIVVFNKAEIE